MEQNPSNSELTQEELKIYDRQRFIGLDVQKKLVDSNILLYKMNGVLCELAKNLVLMGCNLTLLDNSTINEKDIETIFLFGYDDLGKNKADICKQKLNDMNPLVKINIKNPEKFDFMNEEFLKGFDIISCSTQKFDEMKKWDFICKKINKPFYNLLCCGLYGFFYVSLGSEYEYYRTDQNKEKIKQIVKSSFIEETLNFAHCKKPESSRLQVKEIFLAILMMFESEKNNLFHDPFNSKLSDLNIFLNPFKERNFSLNINQENTLKNFANFYGIEFSPVYSVLGSVASQEFIKVIGKNEEPSNGWFVYDSEEGYGKFEIL